VGRHVVKYLLNYGLSERIWRVDLLFTESRAREGLSLDAHSEGSSGNVYASGLRPNCQADLSFMRSEWSR